MPTRKPPLYLMHCGRRVKDSITVIINDSLFHGLPIRGKMGSMKSYLHGRSLSCLIAMVVCSTLYSPPGLCEEGISDKSVGEGIAFPELPLVSLARPKSVEGNTEPAEYWSRRVDALIEAASKAETSTEKGRLLLAAANLLLGRNLEPFSSSVVANIPPDLTDKDKSLIGSTLNRAETLIAESSDLLKTQMPPPKTQDPADQVDGEAPEDPVTDKNTNTEGDQLIHAAETLQSFLNGQRAYLLEETEPGARRRAASALAPLLEDADKKIASAARLWQALLRGLEKDPTAALQILGSPMASPHPETWPYGLFSKVIRCRYQGVQGFWSSALMMLSHIEELLEEWVPEAAHRGDARRYFAYTRLDVLRRWYDSLPPEKAAERQWCARQAEEIVRMYFSVDVSLLRLDPAIPMIFPEEIYKAAEAKAVAP